MSAEPKPVKPESSKSTPNSPDGDAAKRKPMPFEPKTTKNKTTQKPASSGEAKFSSSQPAKSSQKLDSKKTDGKKTDGKKVTGKPDRQGGIPDVVSRRMIRRIAWCSGVPTALGMSTFVVSYLIVSNDWVPLPTYAVLLVSLGWFGLGVLGVSYGVLSASWDEAPGSFLGWSELRINWERTTTEWKAGSKEIQASRKRRQK